MHISNHHSWNVAPEEARRIQVELAGSVERGPALNVDKVRTIAGLDVSSEKENPPTSAPSDHGRAAKATAGKLLTAGVVVCDAETFEILETAEAQIPVTFPYIPGLLSFRETPALLEALKKLRSDPDVLLIDGHGLAHPRRFGIACHIGLLLDKPTIGCAKSLLIGTYSEPESEPGSVIPLVDNEEQIGVVLRTKDGAAPVYVSIGHKIDLPSAVEIVLHSCRGYRLPEPARLAHLYVNTVRRKSGMLISDASSPRSRTF